MILFSPGHARASVNTWRGLFEPSVNTYLEGDVKVSAPVVAEQVPLALSNVAVHKALKDSA